MYYVNTEPETHPGAIRRQMLRTVRRLLEVAYKRQYTLQRCCIVFFFYLNAETQIRDAFASPLVFTSTLN